MCHHPNYVCHHPKTTGWRGSWSAVLVCYGFYQTCWRFSAPRNSRRVKYLFASQNIFRCFIIPLTRYSLINKRFSFSGKLVLPPITRCGFIDLCGVLEQRRSGCMKATIQMLPSPSNTIFWVTLGRTTWFPTRLYNLFDTQSCVSNKLYNLLYTVMWSASHSDTKKQYAVFRGLKVFFTDKAFYFVADCPERF